MIYDAFMFLDEFDVLEIRLRELDSVVDRFVICESAQTFTGKPKPYHFDEQAKRFEPWASKIVRHRLGTVPPFTTYEDRENWNRDSIRLALENIADSDSVICGDVDEIPRAAAIASFSSAGGDRTLSMRSHYFYLNVTAPTLPWIQCKIVSGWSAKTRTQYQIRHVVTELIENAGWHFSSVGGADKVAYKLASFSHADMPHNASMVEGLRNGTWVEGEHSIPIIVGEIDDTYPRFVAENVGLMRERGLIYQKKETM